MSDAQPTGGGTAVAQPSILSQILTQGVARDGKVTTTNADLLTRFTEVVETDAARPEKERTLTKNRALSASIQAQIAEIDTEISRQLDEILHNEAFQKLESAWRGLHYLVSQTETGSMLKLRVLNATKDEIRSDLNNAVDKDQSQLFKKLYEEEYGTFGGNPFTVLVGAYEFGRSTPDIDMLGKIAEVAASAHAPFVASASSELFDMPDFTHLGVPRDLSKAFESTELEPWRAFRSSEDSRYVALVLPRMLLRLPYHPVNNPVDGISFTENVFVEPIHDAEVRKTKPRTPLHESYLWGSAAWAMAARLTDAFAKYQWCAAIRGVEGGGVVAGLPVHVFDTREGDKSLKVPTEVSITDRREKELSDLGFISLVHRKGASEAVFFGGATTQKPIKYMTDSATANARLSAALPYVLAASRFAHYLKVIMRDKVGSFQSRGEIERYLNNWIAQYVLLNDDAPQSAKARFPLREARVDVTEIAGKPGAYNATVFLRPHFQLEELTASIRLVAELPPPAA